MDAINEMVMGLAEGYGPMIFFFAACILLLILIVGVVSAAINGSRLRKKNSGLQRSVDDLSNNLKIANEAANTNEDCITELKELVDNLTDEKQTLLSEREAQSESLTAATTKIEELTAENEKLATALKESADAQAHVAESLKATSEARDKYALAMAELKQKLAELETEKAEISEVAKHCEELETENERLSIVNNALADSIAKVYLHGKSAITVPETKQILNEMAKKANK